MLGIDYQGAGALKRATALHVVLISVTAYGQNQNLQSGSMSYGNGLKVQFVTVAEPALKHSDFDFSGGFRYEGDLVHRIVLNQANKTYFGYSLALEPIEGTTECRLSIQPLSLSVAEIAKSNLHVDASWKVALLPRYPAPQVVSPDDTIALDLLASSDGRQKVVDYIQTSCKQSKTEAAPVSEPPRDFSPDDAELNVSSGNLYINGKPVSGTPTVGDANGPIVWFYYPGKGRFIVSLTPREGYAFQKAGAIRGNRISFQFGGEQYEVRASHPIVGMGHAWNAYVLHDPAYRPKVQKAVFGASSRVESVLARQ